MVVALLLAAPAWWLDRAAGIEAVLWATLICLVPGWAVLLLSHGARLGGNDVQVVLLGMGLRMLTAVAGALGICVTWPEYLHGGFLWWLAILYLAALAVETRLLLNDRSQDHQQHTRPSEHGIAHSGSIL